MPSSFRYLSPKSLATMARIDNTIIPVYTDPIDIPPAVPEPPPSLTLPRGMVTNLRTVSDSNQRTKNQFRPRLGKGSATSYQLRQYAEVTLGGGSLRKVVKLPEGEDENEWLAVNSTWHRGLTFPSKRSLTWHSGGFLQPDQPDIRSYHGVLLASVMS
jgi:MOB kinase activator 1